MRMTPNVAARVVGGVLAVAVAGCVPYDVPNAGYAGRAYAPAPYASPYASPYATPYAPPVEPAYVPPPQVPVPVTAEPLDPNQTSGGPPPGGDPFGGPLPSEPPRADGPAAEPSPAPAPAASGDPVTDLLLTPLPQRDAGAGASSVAKPSAPPAQSPFMGFRPMRGQTAPTP